MTRKRTAKDSSLESRKKRTRAGMDLADASRKDSTMARGNGIVRKNFEERCEQLLAFKDEFGHCNVPKIADPLLWQWCRAIRSVHKRKQQGKKPPMKQVNLSQDRIERLDEIGFEWIVTNGKFEQRFRDLEAFKNEFWALQCSLGLLSGSFVGELVQ